MLKKWVPKGGKLLDVKVLFMYVSFIRNSSNEGIHHISVKNEQLWKLADHQPTVKNSICLSVLGLQHLSRTPKLMMYQATIV